MGWCPQLDGGHEDGAVVGGKWLTELPRGKLPGAPSAGSYLVEFTSAAKPGRTVPERMDDPSLRGGLM